MKKTPVFEYYTESVSIPVNLPDGTQKNIEINPGWSFGKGFHPTTKLCIKELESVFSNKLCSGQVIDKVLDVGCGSGVLSICSVFLGAEKVTGLDIDIIIVSEARVNVSTNGMDSKIDILLGSIEDIGGFFNLVMANILIESMLPMSAELSARVSPGGLLLLSGIKDKDSEIVIERFSSHGLKLREKNIEGEWVSLLMKNPDPG